MYQHIRVIALLILALALTGTAQAQTDNTQTAVTGWQATYWNNTSLSGPAALASNESDLDHDWGFGSPADVVNADRFSARWTSAPNLAAGRYRFTLSVDDGARLWVDGRLLIDAWQVQAEQTYSEETYLSGGSVPITVEYFENTGLARVSLSWTSLSGGFTSRWQGEYFNNRTLSGSPALIRPDSNVNFEWGADSPAPDIINPETFSVRWTRTVDLPAGQYRFDMTVDDGGRLWVNDQLLIDAWQVQTANSYQREISLPGGATSLRMEYFENGGQAVAQLSWTRLHDIPVQGPGTTIDDSSAAFIQGGPPSGWHTEPEGFNDSLTWTQNHNQVQAEYNWARWFPDLDPGVYEVAVYIPDRFSTTSQARYWVSHAGGFELRVVDQSANGGRWVSLGTFEFRGNSSDYVSLANVTFEPDGSRLVAYDAMRWTAVGEGDGLASITTTPDVIRPGTVVTVTGSGFPPGQPITLSLGPPATEPFGQYGQSVVNAEGTVSMTFTMPATWPNGDSIAESLPADGELVILLLTEDGTKALTSVTYAPAT